MHGESDNVIAHIFRLQWERDLWQGITANYGVCFIVLQKSQDEETRVPAAALPALQEPPNILQGNSLKML